MTDNPTRDLIAENARLRSVISFAAESLEENEAAVIAYCILKGALEEPEPISDADLPTAEDVRGIQAHPGDKGRLMNCINAIEEFLCEKEPRVGDALFVLECLKINFNGMEVYYPAEVNAIFYSAFPAPAVPNEEH